MKHMFGIFILAAGMVVAQEPAIGLPGTDTSLSIRPQYEELKAYLSLTEAQITQLTQLQSSYHQRTQTIHNEMAAKHRTLYTEMASDTPNGAAAGEAVVAIANLRKQLTAAEKQILQDAAAVLTDAQKPKLQTLDAARKLQMQIGQAQGLFLLDSGGYFGILPAGYGPADLAIRTPVQP